MLQMKRDLDKAIISGWPLIILFLGIMWGSNEQLVAQSKFHIPNKRSNPAQSLPSTPFSSLPPLTTTVWTFDLNPRPTKDDNQLLRELHDQARHYLSGMVYGYEFRYVPSNPEREINEEFELQLLQEISRGDTGIELIRTWRRGEQLFGQFAYRIPQHGVRWLNAWSNSPTITGGGRAESQLWGDNNAQSAAVEGALLDVVRRHIAAQQVNIPRSVIGKLLIRDGPRLWISSGYYRAELFARIRIHTVEHYQIN